ATISNTPIPDSKNSNKQRQTCSNEQDLNIPESGQAAQMALRKKPRRQIPQDQQKFEKNERAGEQKTDCLDHVSIGLIQAACPKTQETIGQQFNSWPDLMKSGHTLKLLIGLGDREFGHGVERQGNLLALVCLAVIAEKALRDPELISHPAAYFRAMIDRAGEEQLNLVKSLHGLCSKTVR
ncbi:replication initiation protein RepC, partial [Cohaesibacter celericrescens]|uniref:replication initiation protein RepC n=1 Tax=Cohaesibacter celericrescens TaxID=2067669 RepID=UPI001FE1FD99